MVGLPNVIFLVDWFLHPSTFRDVFSYFFHKPLITALPDFRQSTFFSRFVFFFVTFVCVDAKKGYTSRVRRANITSTTSSIK